jgi:hypothetical protein
VVELEKIEEGVAAIEVVAGSGVVPFAWLDMA